MYDLILRDATLVTSSGREVADVAIKNGKIAYVGPRPPRRAKQEISAIGKFLMPGVIDTGVLFDPDGSANAWEAESRAAVSGGVTSILCLPWGQRPIIDRKSARARMEQARGRSWCHYGLWGAATEENLDEIKATAQEGLTLATLACLGAREDGLGVGPEHVKTLLDAPGTLGVQLCEVTLAGDVGAQSMLDELRRAAGRVHLVHLSTALELDLLDPVRGNLPVTAGVTPHHLFLSQDDGHVATTFPPVRAEHDRKTLWAAVKRGRLDCVASDHHPSIHANGSTVGIPGTELLFPLMLSAVKYGRLSLESLASLCAEAPARIFGLENKGRIARGADADLIMFSEGELTRVSPNDLLSTADWSPYLDREAAPKPEMVMVAGEVVAQRGEVVADAPRGRPLIEG